MTPGSKDRPTHTRGYDAVVVGSGYGGGVAACRLGQAGLRVLILEKGKAWDSSQFPTTFWQLLQNTHLCTPLGSVGNRNSLYQLHLQGLDSSCALVGCGLGGGSLVNAGVVVPVPKATLRHPDWPKQWCGKEWQASESRAMAMLEPQAVPTVFPKSQVMEAIASDIDIEGVVQRDAIRGSFRFQPGSGPNSAGVTLDTCVGCGNCVTGCPYNAKNSVDKNYLAVAIQAGAQVQTECEVLYVGHNYSARQTARQACAAGHGGCPCTTDHELGNGNPPSSRGTRRWRVYLNEVDYVESDFVILAAGTLGTSEILLRSKEKGLGLSERLGMGFSCNGNHVGIVAGTKAPTMGHALSKQQFPNIPMASRTGPCISASHSSPSLKFVVQGAAVPSAYPEILFKTIFSHKVSLPGGLLYALWRELKLAVYGGNKHAIILNVMGSDAANGTIELDSKTGRLTLCPPDDPSLSNKIKTCQRLTKRLGGVLCMSRFRSTSVHLLGGCNAGQDASCAVTNYKGQVFSPYRTSPGAVHAGLYLCDGSIIPCSVGINPTGTITTAAELVASHIVRDAANYCCTAGEVAAAVRLQGALQLRMQQDESSSGQVGGLMNSFSSGKDRSSDVLDLAMMDCAVTEVNDQAEGPNASAMDKFPNVDGVAEQGEEPSVLPPLVRDPDQVVVRETVKGTLGGLPCTLHLVMHMGGSGKHSCLLRGRVGGRMVMKYVEQRVVHIVDGFVDMCWVDARSQYTQHMHYHLLLTSSTGARFALDARKTMNPFLFAARGWQESTTLHTTLRQLTPPHHSAPCVPAENLESGFNCESHSKMVFLEGQLHVSSLAMLKSIVTLRGRRRFQFLGSLLQSLVHTYIVQIPREPSVPRGLASASTQEQRHEYPACNHHSLTTQDGQAISMKQWPREGDRGVVLMLNGYSTESFCLPTEPHDLVRTVHKEGYEPWLLRSRLHPMHSCTSFTIDDLAKYDLPAAFARIGEVKGTSCRVHVVAHCVGGLSMHMALLGSYVPVSSVASLACTNSAMFFNLTASARAKLIPPLIPISMRILGSKTVLAMTRDDNKRHNLLRSIARFLPRPECCSCNECAIFSGIFGSTFWHSNVTARMHDWQHKEAAPCLPMAGFPHLRNICLAERVVDAAGRDTYLLHPERLALPTTYISGGRPILVTPETSSRAHLFMRHHHPQFRHERVLVHNYGHSDLLIGEHAHLDVFPHILHHLHRCSSAQPPEEEAGAKRQLAPWEHLPPTATPSLLPPIILLFLALLFFVNSSWIHPQSWLARCSPF